MSENRRLFGDAWAFTQSAGKGAWNAGSGMVEGLKDLAKGGYKLATDGKARDTAWETTKQLAESTKKYAEAAYEDPGKAYRDARDGALTAYDKFEQARDLADAEGRSAEFWGEMAGGGAFEVATMLIPVGALAKVGALGKVAKGAEVAKAIGKAENIEDILGASPKAKGVLGKPVILEADYKCSLTQKCPNKDNDNEPVIIKSLDELEEGSGGKNADAPVLKGRRPKNPERPVKNEDGSLTEYGEWYYERPSGYRKGVRDKTFEDAKGNDQKVRDPLTEEEIKFDDEWDMGHKPKQEFRKHKADAAERGIGRKEFLDEHNKSENYRPETPNTNRSHKLEDVTDAFE